MLDAYREITQTASWTALGGYRLPLSSSFWPATRSAVFRSSTSSPESSIRRTSGLSASACLTPSRPSPASSTSRRIRSSWRRSSSTEPSTCTPGPTWRRCSGPASPSRTTEVWVSSRSRKITTPRRRRRPRPRPKTDVPMSGKNSGPKFQSTSGKKKWPKFDSFG